MTTRSVLVAGVDVGGTTIEVELVDDDPVADGVGIPGVVHDGEVLTVPDLARWHEELDLISALTERLSVPVALGTGIGGGLFLDGRPYTGSRGAAGEIGHVVVHANGALCMCGRRGCAEAYAGRRSMRGVASAMVDAGWQTSLFEIRDNASALIVSG